ncbi:MAG: endo-1,4-beta-xylanase [Lachnospiraceae bacterium]|nr:endo-1,4-beta-xylanase [Lachnospiraceae bacterium]
MKKFLALMLVIAMVFSLAGCSSSGNDQKTTPTVTEAVPTAEPTEAAPTAEPTEAVPTEAVPTEPSPTEAVIAEPTEAEPVDPLEGKYLKDLFAEHGMKVGTCLNMSMVNRAGVKRILLANYNSVTMENEMKPDSILNRTKSQEAGEIVVEFKNDALNMLKFAKENNFSLRGHTLVWYSQTPEWIFHEDFDTTKAYVDRDTMLARMEGYIKNVFKTIDELGYTDLFYAYDVVNEAWLDNGQIRKNHWTDIIGDDYLWYAFYYADKYAPESIDLYYNDFNEQFKTQALVNFVNTLVDENGRYLIDGIGLQAHLYTSDDLTKYFNTIETLGETGLKLQLTELDVCLGKYQHPLPGNDENFRAQGRFYYDLINGIFERVDAGKVKMDALTFWGICDNMSWRKEYKPLLYNDVLKGKYALYGVFQLKDYAGFE